MRVSFAEKDFMTRQEIEALRKAGARITEPQEGFQQKFTRSSCDTVFGGGVLNPQPLTSRVRTPEGFTEISSLKKGDRIYGITKKEQEITNIHYEGEKDCIRIILEDGSCAESSLDHKWPIWRPSTGDMTAVAFELLEAYQTSRILLREPDIWFFRIIGGELRPVRLKEIIDIGKKETACVSVSNEDELYITDDDIVTRNCGKTFAAILMVAEPSLDPRFRAAFTRRNLANLKQGGGVVDDFREAYGDIVKITTSENPRITFPTGAYVDCIHIADEAPGKLMERAKGWQYDVFYMDELTSYEFSTFSIVGTRARGKSWFSGHVMGTLNPKRSHWTRTMLDWYVGLDGFIIPKRDGVVRYYYQPGETVDDIIWGDTKEEVYKICKTDIDRKLRRLGGKDWTYKEMIRSFVFYIGRMSENKASVGNNANYIGAVSAVGGRRAQQLIEGNFNVDEEEEDKMPIPGKDAQAMFTNDECRNGDRWITVDLADVGKDNLIALLWDGFHLEDAMVVQHSTPRMNYEKIKIFADINNIPYNRIIYDGTHGAYMYDYMPEAQPFISAASPIGKYAIMANRLKDECYLRLINAINNGRISVSSKVASMPYRHQVMKSEMTFQGEILDECSVVRLRENPTNGRMKLIPKKEMNSRLGKSRSMDVLDPMAMRMLPVLAYQYGEELDMTSAARQRKTMKDKAQYGFDIYEDSNWA